MREQHRDNRFTHQHDRHRRLQGSRTEGPLLQNVTPTATATSRYSAGTGEQGVSAANVEPVGAGLGQYGDHAKSNCHSGPQRGCPHPTRGATGDHHTDHDYRRGTGQCQLTRPAPAAGNALLAAVPLTRRPPTRQSAGPPSPTRRQSRDDRIARRSAAAQTTAMTPAAVAPTAATRAPERSPGTRTRRRPQPFLPTTTGRAVRPRQSRPVRRRPQQDVAGLPAEQRCLPPQPTPPPTPNRSPLRATPPTPRVPHTPCVVG